MSAPSNRNGAPVVPRSMRRTAISSVFLVAAGAGLSFVGTVVAARILGAYQFGIYAYALSWAYLLEVVARFGLDVSLLRFVAAYRVTGEWALLRGIIRFGNTVNLAIGTAVVLVGSGVILVASGFDPSSQDVTVMVALLAVPLLALAASRQATLKGLRHVTAGLVPELIVRPIAIAVTLLVVFWLVGRPSSVGAIVVNVACIASSYALGAWLLARFRPRESVSVRPVVRWREWVGVSGPMALVAGGNVILRQSDIIMLGILAGPIQAGIYAAVGRIASVVSLGLQGVNSVSAPLLSEGFAQNDPGHLTRIARHSAQLIVLFTVPVAIVLAVAGRTVLSAFGEDFRDGYAALLVLLIGWIVASLAGSVANALSMSGHHRTLARLVLVSAITNLILNAVLIPPYGMLGAAIATSTMLVGRNVAMWVLVRRRLDLDVSVLSLFHRDRS